jgi:hypothetical protein
MKKILITVVIAVVALYLYVGSAVALPPAHDTGTCSLQPVSPENPALTAVCTPIILQPAVTDIAQDEYLGSGFTGPWSVVVNQYKTKKAVIRVTGLSVKRPWSAHYVGDGIPFFFPQPVPSSGANRAVEYDATTEGAYWVTTGGVVGAPPHPFHITESGNGAVTTLTVSRAV